MDGLSLAQSFGDSLTEEVMGIAEEYTELGLDALVEDGAFKDIPIVSTVVGIYRIGKSFREKHHVAKLISFLNEINDGIVDERKRYSYQQKFASNKSFRNRELEYILILLDRYISFDKPQMLAKLYMAYLDEVITWIEFAKYAEVIDRLVYGDIHYLDAKRLATLSGTESEIDSVLRLQSVGLVSRNVALDTQYDPEDGELSFNDPKGYMITSVGEKLINILRSGKEATT